MSVTVVFDVPGMTPQQYDRVMQDLEAAGHVAPAGRMHHIASQTDSGWHVVDVWESEEKLEKFAEVLMPTLAKAGVQPPQPKVLRTHNIVNG